MQNLFTNVLAFHEPSTMGWLIILVVAVLIFGKRLPEIARNFGRSITDFKKGMKEASDVKDEMHTQAKDTIEDVKKEISKQ